MSKFTATSGMPGSEITICVDPAPSQTVYGTVAFYDSQGRLITTYALRFTAEEPCETVTVPNNTDSGFVYDEAEQIEDIELQID